MSKLPCLTSRFQKARGSAAVGQSLGRCLAAALLSAASVGISAQAAFAQVGLANSGPFDQREIQTVTVRITNPSPDAAFNQRIEDAVRRGVRLFPGQRYSDEAISLSLAQVTRRNPQIASATYEPFPSVMGGVDVTVTVTLGDGVQPPGGRGMAATGNAKDFPLILDRNGTDPEVQARPLRALLRQQQRLVRPARPDARGQPARAGHARGRRLERLGRRLRPRTASTASRR